MPEHYKSYDNVNFSKNHLIDERKISRQQNVVRSYNKNKTNYRGKIGAGMNVL